MRSLVQIFSDSVPLILAAAGYGIIYLSPYSAASPYVAGAILVLDELVYVINNDRAQINAALQSVQKLQSDIAD